MVFEVKNYAAMREAIESLCRFLSEQCVPSESVFDSKLVASELVGNVLRHSQGTATLCGEIKDGFVELHVLSDVTFIPPIISQKAEVYAEQGRGLFLVDSVCHERKTSEEGGIFVRIKIR